MKLLSTVPFGSLVVARLTRFRDGVHELPAPHGFVVHFDVQPKNYPTRFRISPVLDPIRRSNSYVGEDGYGSETQTSHCECGKPFKVRRETKKAERVTLGWLALTLSWIEL
jgi:hypothetical protein